MKQQQLSTMTKQSMPKQPTDQAMLNELKSCSSSLTMLCVVACVNLSIGIACVIALLLGR